MERTKEGEENEKNIRFQFPSNGKVHGKPGDSIVVKLDGESFNSLQTGRYMESLILRQVILPLMLCFNSLQTGRYMERDLQHL